ncbi:sigma-70 family RNA polymerase sigma factor [Ruminococcus sp.]|uniref:RNA polymerase sigma factor n=1 Tax=Ruminococcus sp. TaxID=41978 RepID=UPI003F060F19
MDISKLVEQTKKGDNKSFDKLYKLTEKEIWFTCISFLKNETTAQDIMQETYITAFLKIQTLDKTVQFRSWLNRIAVNKCKDYLKGKGEIELNDEILENSLVADEISLPEEYVTNKSKRECILSIMQKTLSDVQYQTVICYYFNEMSVEEIATLFECSKGTVLSRLNYSRAKMKTAIEKYEEENNDRLHGVVFVPLFGSIFKEEAKNLTVPKIDLVLPKQGSNSIASIGAENAVKTASKGLVSSVARTRIIAMLLGMTVICGTSISTGVLAGCGKEDLPIATTASTTEVTTEPTETVSEDVVEAIKDNGLSVDDNGTVLDKDGKELEVKDGKIEVTNADGTKTVVRVDEIKGTTQPTQKPTQKATEPKETQKATKATQPTKKPVTQPTTKATQPTTKKPATPTPTQKPTEKVWHEPVYKTVHHPAETKVVHHDAVTHEEPVYKNTIVYICNQCGAELADANARKAHYMSTDDCWSYHTADKQIQTGTTTVVDKEAYDETVVVKEAWDEKVLVSEGYWEYK